jgi:hypothetical protein
MTEVYSIPHVLRRIRTEAPCLTLPLMKGATGLPIVCNWWPTAIRISSCYR